MKNSFVFHVVNNMKLAGLNPPRGGYTVAVKPRKSDGKLAVAICQCPFSVIYSPIKGHTVAMSRLKRNIRRVVEWKDFPNLLNALASKINGALTYDESLITDMQEIIAKDTSLNSAMSAAGLANRRLGRKGVTE